LKVIYFAYDPIYGRRIKAFLQSRSPDAVQSLWEEIPLPRGFAARIMEVIEIELPWPRHSLSPEDSCDMIFKAWRVFFADCMEVERCMIRFERIIGRRVPDSADFRGRTLRELVEQLYAASQLPNDSPRAPSPKAMAMLVRPVAFGFTAGALFGLLTGISQSVMIYGAIGGAIGLLIGLIVLAARSIVGG
jgi:hypothetical protein